MSNYCRLTYLLRQTSKPNQAGVAIKSGREAAVQVCPGQRQHQESLKPIEYISECHAPQDGSASLAQAGQQDYHPSSKRHRRPGVSEAPRNRSQGSSQQQRTIIVKLRGIDVQGLRSSETPRPKQRRRREILPTLLRDRRALYQQAPRFQGIVGKVRYQGSEV